MKLTQIGKRSAITALIINAVFYINGCAILKPSNSYFGHGQYRCFYHNDLSKKEFDAKNGDQEKAMREAKALCLRGGFSPELHCQFADCLFK